MMNSKEQMGKWHIAMRQKNYTQLMAGMIFLGLALVFLTGCQPQNAAISPGAASPTPEDPATPFPEPTPFATRPPYGPAELVEYTAQSGDTLPALAIRFNTSVEEILAANTFIPHNATTMPPGMPMQIPIYYEPFWGSPYQIIPDSLFVNGPAQIEFDTAAFVDEQPGWLKDYRGHAGNATRSGAEIVDYVAENFSVSPQVLLAMLEYQTGALTRPSIPQHVNADYLLGHETYTHKGLYLQLVWLANYLNNGYYAWRTGRLEMLELADGTVEAPDPWQNAATVAFQYYFSREFDVATYRNATGPNGIAQIFSTFFGNPWGTEAHIPGSLTQPELRLPFESGKTWAYTGGPHTGWGTGEPLAAIDFAPPSLGSGCYPSREWNTAMADGVVARVDEGVIELDLDGDGDPRTGWVLLYLHLATQDKAALGSVVTAGQRVGHPSCEGGTSTGTHIHVARKFNGEWIPAEGPLGFNLEGWVAYNGDEIYKGTLRRFSQTVTASEGAVQSSYITAGE